MAALLIVGCETRSASEKIIVTPSEVPIVKFETVQFTASNGSDYHWSLENEAWGILSSRTGSQVTYTSIHSASSDSGSVLQVLTVTSVIPGSSDGGSSGSNETVRATGQAFIKHR